LRAECRFPILGGLLQPRGGTVRHDAVAWGYARAAARWASTSSRNAKSPASAASAARSRASKPRKGSSARRSWDSRLPATPATSPRWPALRLPIEIARAAGDGVGAVKPVLDTVVTSGAVHFYVSQSDKGELVMGGDLDFYNSYAQRGNLPRRARRAACLALFPSFGRLKLMRTWGGIMDMTMDGSPIIAGCRSPDST
jgi:glycine/D-amino acid oxidase-like deaminating enzyme